MVCGWRLLTEAAARSTSSLAGCSPTGLLSWNPRPAVTTRRSQRTPVHANVASSTKSGLLHQSVHQYRHLACTSVHQCGPQAAPNPTSGLTHQHQRSGRIPAGQTLEYACVPPIYALAVFSLFNLKMQNSYKQRTPTIWCIRNQKHCTPICRGECTSSVLGISPEWNNRWCCS